MIRLGTFDQFFPKDSQIYMEGQNDFTVMTLGEDGKPALVLGNSVDRKLKFTVREDCKLRVAQPKISHLSIDARPIKPVHEVVSDIPVEVDVDLEPAGMEQKIKEFCAQIVAHEYGSQSDEMDTLDEMFDFDDDGNEVPLSGYEVAPMSEEVPVEVENEDNTSSDGSNGSDSVSDGSETVPDK